MNDPLLKQLINQVRTLADRVSMMERAEKNRFSTLTVTGDVYANGRTQGLNQRLERLFGVDRPAHAYQFTQRQMRLNDYPNHIAGFEDTQASPYSFGAAPGGFSTSIPSGSQIRSNDAAHWLTIAAGSGSGAYLQWTSAVAKTNLDTLLAVSPTPGNTDIVLAEIRFWDVQNPIATSKYHALRFNLKGSTVPNYALRVGLFYGTGLNYAVADGTLIGTEFPVIAGRPLRALVQFTATPSVFLYTYDGEGLMGFKLSTSASAQFGSFKTVRFVTPANTFQYLHLDDVVIS